MQELGLLSFLPVLKIAEHSEAPKCYELLAPQDTLMRRMARQLYAIAT